MTKRPRRQPGESGWDLDAAEQQMIDAGDDPEARALAMRRHQEAIRNMIIRELAPGFVHMFESVVTKKIDEIAAKMDSGFTEVRGLRGDVTALQAEFHALNTRHGKQWRAVSKRISAIERLMADRPRQRQAEHEEIIEAAVQEVLRRLAERGGDG